MMPTLPEHVAAMEAELWRVVVAAYQAGKAETEVENVALRAVVEAARDYRAYCRAREATWASWTQCEDAAHPGHTEDDCPAWGSVASDTMSDGDPEPIFAALAALDTPTTTSESVAAVCERCGGLGWIEVEESYSEAAHAPGCDGYCRNCPIEVEAWRMVQETCPDCGGATPTTTSERLAPCAECGPDSNCGKVPQL